MQQKLSGRNLLLVGFTLFSMFFGAGNLIFPPHLGAQAGANLWPAFAGLAVSAIGLPIAGVVAVARAGGLDKLASRVHPLFAPVFTVLVYLSIGPCLAIPRTASTSFQMLVPLVGGGQGSIFRAGRGIVGRQRVGKAPGEQHHDQPDQAGAEDAAQQVGEFVRV